MSDRLPVLVADLLEESARDFLEGVARENEETWVPLVAAPVDASPHILEVYTPSGGEPLRLVAVPLGPPSEYGFPLRLSMPGSELPPRTSEVPAVNVVEVGVEGIDVVEPAQPGKPGRRLSSYSFARADTPTQMKGAQVSSRKPSIRVSISHAKDLGGEPPPPPAVVHDPLVGRSIAGGKLVIEDLIGTGMMGAVYRAVHRELRMPVAVKVMHEVYQRDVEFCRRFYAEALAASRLDHPNLVRVIDFGQEADGLLYLAMEFLPGAQLRQIAYEEGPMSARRIAELMMQVCAGLGQAHARGIIHRDVKPDNFMIVTAHNDDGEPIQQLKVCDFGLAIRRSEATTERFAGTPVYMSPEQVRGEDLDLRTDIYSCGVIIYELATGHVPFLADDPRAVMQLHLTEPVPSVLARRPDADPRIDAIVRRAMSKVRDERYPSMRELRADLKELLRSPAFDLEAEVRRASSRPPPAQPEPSPPPPSSPHLSIPAPAPPQRHESDEFAAVLDPRAEPMRKPSPSWLEEKENSYAQFFNEMNTKKAEDTRTSLTRDPKAWIARFLAERDPRAFDFMFDEIELLVPQLAAAADARTLWALSSTIHGLATDDSRPAKVKARAQRFQRVFYDPTHLARIAERMELRNDEHREPARSMLVRAGVAGAYALYGARVKHAMDPAVRRPFIDTMRIIGEAGWPVVRAALEKIPDAAITGEHPVAATLAEDLLLCVPALRDESAGNIVAKYVRAKEPRLCRAATQALGRLWAERAAPLLLGLLSDPDDGVRIAAIHGLRQISALDEHAVRRLAPILTGRVPSGPQLYQTVVVALEFVTLDARPVAVPLLVQLLRDASTPDVIVLAASKSLLSVMGNEARAVVIDRSDRAAEPLKSHLFELLKDPELPQAELENLD
ncbi:MAG: protein kinase [Deltaproteobacteria bacterium]|nr:protein kinase [Deltaproteobacteria bacterium]